ncbi:hypothetical protein A7U60_g954 [Sanghuangporus baumii]|uniref:Uncharacterized protein n=1 Tax=Sanghuangporus baumii TaxID=108892 RepID=A0A9Q5I4Y9_SANBA|nr:hypothetical protein A7U60_g954 [Sanghuangporus baumii]
MPKKFKVKLYEKDNDDHYVVVLNPWAQGYKPRSQEQIDWMGAWLRIAFRRPKEKYIVKNIYSVETRRKRSEVIVRISASVDIRLGLGLHRWGEFMKEEQLERIKLQSGDDLSDDISYIFLYNWTLHGDPAEHQWQEWFPRQDEIPPNIIIKMDYPEPEWSEIPSSDSRLRSLLLPLPIPALSYDLNAVQSARIAGNIAEDSIIENRFSSLHHKQEETKARKNSAQISGLQANSKSASETTLYSSHQPPLHLPRSGQDTCLIKSVPGSSKADKLDPYEEDDKAQACLSTFPVTGEYVLRATSRANTVAYQKVSKPKQTTSNLPYKAQDIVLRRLFQELFWAYRERDSPMSQTASLWSSVSAVFYSCSFNNNEVDWDRLSSQAEEQDIKPNLRTDEYRPSEDLAHAICQLRGSTVHSDKEDRKPVVKKEEYNPSGALGDAFSRHPGEAPLDTDESRSRNLKRRLKKEGGAGVVSPSDPKRIKTEME